ncbi:hypothetical protein MCEL_21850 [Mycolicibacterium celeriflavum]|uniref:Uncharacterized protein n=1 Tax=Mycolicibacterium celeriflavum TaxID=1249101 RepID=A0A7I7RHX4_MYCCF|nr:hypothetical protein MCEL_21850 [Mycolicibacterium celeriflavum]
MGQFGQRFGHRQQSFRSRKLIGRGGCAASAGTNFAGDCRYLATQVFYLFSAGKLAPIQADGSCHISTSCIV